MLDRSTHQAAGLLALRSHSGPRMMAMVSHGDQQAELPLLWRLCLALVDFGYAVTVLDATTSESPGNPGLEQLLDDGCWHDEENPDAVAWNVLASGRGLQALAATPQHRSAHLRQLGQLFRHDGVVILYSNAEWMVPLLGDSAVKPLLAVSPMRTSLLTSYLALKRLLIKGKLRPTIVNMVQEQGMDNLTAQRSAVASLGACAKNFLHYDVKAQDIAILTGEEPRYGEIQQLALRLMESALELNAEFPPVASAYGALHPHAPDHFAGSH